MFFSPRIVGKYTYMLCNSGIVGGSLVIVLMDRERESAVDIAPVHSLKCVKFIQTDI